jgi:hypothetical protein
VPRLQWESDEARKVRIITDVGRDELLKSPLSEIKATSGEVLVLGIPFQRESWSLVATETEEGLACSEPLYWGPPMLMTALPELTLTARDPDQAEGGYTAAGMLTEKASLLVLLDEYGEYVWTQTTGEGFISRVYFDRNKSGLEYMSWAQSWDGPASIRRVTMSGEVWESTEVTGGHTDYIRLPEGGYAVISYDLRQVVDDQGEVHSILGDRIVEVDSEGQEREVWSTFDLYTPDLSQDYWLVEVGEDKNLKDWTHGNGLAYDRGSDDYIMSLYGLGSVVRIDRATGEMLWQLSDSHGGFVSTTEETLVQATHSIELLSENHLLLFNRNISNPLDAGDTELDNACSEAIEVELSPEDGTATKTWSYQSDECVLVLFYGEARRLENGNTLVIFSSSGQISEANPAGETVWQVNADVGGAFTFGERADSLY